ncbi:glycoside hydrolase family 31 protein [Francisella frigiditurris]|uniref:Glycosyl hydrolases 31 family protein n=1 Tax=Francisella frigiditurris TaxID=1542390 RepID=A0A1J0KSH0_9GAMM|nr:glycoside hydrolase family 31 protein [Francisella frigiditurris]APC96580.1 glycosyl hydrolases 31 family protein [Francisella frigiditurris]
MLDIRKFKLEEISDTTVTFKLEEKNIYARVLILEENIFRILITKGLNTITPKTWSFAKNSEISFEGIDKLDISQWTCPNFTVNDDEEGIISIYTENLLAEIKLDGFHITWFEKRNNKWLKVAQDLHTQAYNFDYWSDRGAYHALAKEPKAMFFGLGEKSGALNRDKRRFIMRSTDPMGYDAETSDPLYKHIPFFISHNPISKTNFGIFYDNLSDSVFNFGKEIDNYHGPYIHYDAKAGDLDYYFISGEKISDITETFSQITGKTALPPYWSLYYSGSTMTYTDLPDAQEQMNNFINDCKKYDIQCGSFQLSSGYTSIGNKRYVFNWNYTKFPDVEKFTKKYQDNGIKLCANIKPCLLQDHPKRSEIEAFNGYINNKEYNKPELVQYWDELGYYLDFTNPQTINWWQSNVTEQLLKKGISSTWNDNNEYEVYNGLAVCNGFGEEIEIKHVKPVQGLLMTKASYEAQINFAPNERPYLITRSGCAGLQRYAQTWTGDNNTDWKTLPFNLEMAKGLSLSGIYNFGHDIGGFSGPAPTPEMLLRWIQHGIFYPRFTIHSWNEDKTVNTPWMYPSVFDNIQKAFSLRNEVLPYIYQLCYEAHSQAKPIIKPTFYDFENDANTFKDNQEFLLGRMLIANILEQGQTKRQIYLPKGSSWYDYYTGEIYQGGQTICLDVDETSIPIFVRENTVIPVNIARAGFNKFDIDISYKIFPPLKTITSTHSIYMDDGKTNNYLKGKFGFVNITLDNSKSDLNIKWDYQGDDEFKVTNINIINMQEI